MLTLELVERYRQVRVGRVPPGAPVCLRPAANLHFLQQGIVTACCVNKSHVLGMYPRDSVAQIWNGEPARRLREALGRHDLSLGCQECEQQIINEDFVGFHGREIECLAQDLVDHLERTAPEDSAIPWQMRPLELIRPGAPRTLEFEIHNTCNLECVMCSGDRSSRIRSRRMGEPPIPNPYDEAFLEQLEPFLPQVRLAIFVGGEPFLIKLYYKLWERISERFPRTKILIVTNGTIVSDRVRRLLERLDVEVHVSVDSIHKSTYESIRVGASFEAVMDNCRVFQQILRGKGKKLEWRHCVMRKNWIELPDILRYCNENDIRLMYNQLDFPLGLSINTLPPREIDLIADYWRRAAPLPPETETQEYNARMFQGLIHRTQAFTRAENRRQAVAALEKMCERTGDEKRGTTALPLAADAEEQPFPMMVLRYMMDRIVFENERQCGESSGFPEGAETIARLRQKIRARITESHEVSLLEGFIQLLVRFYVNIWGAAENHSTEVFKRASVLSRLILQHPARLRILDDLLDAAPAAPYQTLLTRDVAGLNALLRDYYGAA